MVIHFNNKYNFEITLTSQEISLKKNFFVCSLSRYLIIGCLIEHILIPHKVIN